LRKEKVEKRKKKKQKVPLLVDLIMKPIYSIAIIPATDI
jgi:hypothetical protein